MNAGTSALELVTLVVDDYDRAIRFFVDVVGFELVRDEPAKTNDGRVKRWVVVRPPGGQAALLLARADGETQARVVGAQAGGRVGFFLRVSDFDATYQRLAEHGVAFAGAPREEDYGRVVVFQDLFGNKWDLLGPRPQLADHAEREGTPVTIVGRSSSHFTRVARIFAEELRVPYELEIVRDLLSTDVSDYAENPAMKIPALRSGEGTWFGALPACRALARHAGADARILWPEHLTTPIASNAQQLVDSAMSTGVGLILAKVGRDAAAPSTRAEDKMRASLLQTMAWLDAHAEAVLATLPPRDVSFLEVSLFCLVDHLGFREVLDTTPFTSLSLLRARFGERASARATPYRFDA